MYALLLLQQGTWSFESHFGRDELGNVLTAKQDCQAKAWSEKEHKKFCKTLSRKDIKLMHFLKYETYDGSISFK